MASITLCDMNNVGEKPFDYVISAGSHPPHILVEDELRSIASILNSACEVYHYHLNAKAKSLLFLRLLLQ